MKYSIVLIALLPLSVYATDLIDLDSPLRTIAIKNNSALKAIIFYTDENGAGSYKALRPNSKMLPRQKCSATITFQFKDQLYIWFPKTNTQWQPTILENSRKFIITNKGAKYKNYPYPLQNLHFDYLSSSDRESLSSSSLSHSLED
jgi:hypothetical protein